MNGLQQNMELEIDGMGIVLFSPGMVKDIPIGSNFLTNEFNHPDDIGSHIRKGDITGFCTGSSGCFKLNFRYGYPDKDLDKEYPISVRLGLQVVGGEIHVIDLFWLMEFDPECPNEQIIPVEDGFYHITLNTKRPDSGIWGDNQTIYIYLNPLTKMPQLAWNGVPYLYHDISL